MTNTYRLYTRDVAEGLTDFNDQTYHVLMSDTNKKIALIYRENISDYVVAVSYTTYPDYQAIDWKYGHYHTDLEEAIKDYQVRTSRVHKLLNSKVGLDLLDWLMNIRRDAIYDGNIPGTHWDLVSSLDLVIDFVLTNPEIHDEEKYAELFEIVGSN